MKDERGNTEWINEYQALKQVNPANPFVVPEGYFQEMEQQVMGLVRLDELKKTNPVNEFTVPENYFNELEQNIQSRIAIDEVLDNKESFTVPENYFSDLEQNIQSRIAVEEALNNKESFTVPENYFNELEQNIQSRIAIEEVLNNKEDFTVPADYFNELGQNIQSRIAIEESIGVGEGFAIPEGYFMTLENKILQQTTLQPNQKAVKKEQQGVILKLWASHAVKYATAACFSLVIGTGILVSEFNTTNTAHQRSYLHKAVSKIPNDEIETYLQLSNDAPSILDNSDQDDAAVQAALSVEQTKN